MCGIIAIIGRNKKNDCINALQRIIHRGRDSTQIYESKQIAIGFNRLAINDLSEKGMQPFEYENLVGVFNGEIFNTAYLAKKYQISLTSKSDMEIILPLFEKVKYKIIDALDGFYSGLIYNKETQEIYTLRDYIGKKPLFFGINNQCQFISSELKAFTKITKVQYIPKGISGIKAGKIINYQAHYFDTLIEENLKDILKESVRKRLTLENSQKVGVFLSGGLDSSIIASIVASETNNVIYYTLGNQDAPDSIFVKKLAKALNITSQLKYISIPKNEAIRELIEKVVYITESYNPSIISNGVATYLLSQKAKEDQVKVVLSGEGADELFCGYKISKNVKEAYEKSKILIENLHYTELRRLDLTSMANTIEVRCPFLDKKVYEKSRELSLKQLNNKQILRELFASDLPIEIVNRKKISLDVGSGIRKLVVECLKKTNKLERKALKDIWEIYFNGNNSENAYYYKYPIFDLLIDERGTTH